MAKITVHRPQDVDQRVRWKQGQAWRYGHYSGAQHTEPDGSLRVYADVNGGARSLPAAALQQETRGPRGGRRWEWIIPRPAPAPAPARPAWDPPEGPAEMFDQAALFEVAS